MATIYQVRVIVENGKRHTIDLCNTEEQMQRMTVGELRKKIDEKIPQTAGCREEDMILICKDKCLKGDSSLLSEYGIQHMSVIHMGISLPDGGPLPPWTDYGLGDKEGDTRRSKECLIPDV
ncbi:hypothetical protein ATANTOWER_015863 [Ataeniobius toweri]|uniref:Ubiquitin-like domain-containing protein n=1 Tax=Ataeniobius toweri TaxID=208326 RepID=A0ABU7CIY4_9TELE|nr:hypothetical protein [Ataeniobius toweri]